MSRDLIPEVSTLNPTPNHGRFAFLVRALLTRLRFLILFGLLFGVIGNWDRLQSTWERLTTGTQPDSAISSDTEFFCPMDPGVLSDWPEKCPVCNMTLVKRKKGEMIPLPDGSISRMQYSPNRLWLGGVQTVTATETPLFRTLELTGTLEPTSAHTVTARVFHKDLPWITTASEVQVQASEPTLDQTPTHATILAVEPAPHSSFRTLKLQLDGEWNTPGNTVRVQVKSPAELLEPFRSLPSKPPELVPGEPRVRFECMEHRDVVRLAPGLCPRDQQELMSRPLTDQQRIQWWCPMHPDVVANAPGTNCQACGGMKLVPRVIRYRKPGMVLAIPATSVIFDGKRSVVYVDQGGGQFEGRLVTVGPRCGEMVPVAAGLEPGDKVVAQGAFLLDAETQLNPGLAGTYFGAGSRPESAAATAGSPSKTRSQEATALAGLEPADRALAELQKTCPVTGKPLGSMGMPPRIEVNGRPVFVCCDGCTDRLKAQPEKFLSQLKRPTNSGPNAAAKP